MTDRILDASGAVVDDTDDDDGDNECDSDDEFAADDTATKSIGDGGSLYPKMYGSFGVMGL